MTNGEKNTFDLMWYKFDFANSEDSDQPQADQSSLYTSWVDKDLSFLHVDSEDTNQTGWTPRLFHVFPACIAQVLGLITQQHICVIKCCFFLVWVEALRPSQQF